MQSVLLFVALIISGNLAFPRNGINLLAKYSNDESDAKDDNILYKGDEKVLKDDEAVFDPRDLTDAIAILEEQKRNQEISSNVIKKLKGQDDTMADDEKEIQANEEISNIISKLELQNQRNRISNTIQKFKDNNIMDNEGPNDIIEDDEEIPESNEISNNIEKVEQSQEISFSNKIGDEEDDEESKDSSSNEIIKKSSEDKAEKRLRKLRRKSFEIGFMQGFLEAYMDQELIRPKFRRNIKSLKNEVFRSKGHKRSKKLARKFKEMF